MKKKKGRTEDDVKQFIVLSVCRADVKAVCESNNIKYVRMSDSDMERLASKLGDVLLSGGDYWLGIKLFCAEVWGIRKKR